MITDAHKAFARAMVALAREHKMNQFDVNMTCRLGFRHEGPGSFDTVRFTWSEGRHGAESRIEIHAAEQVYISEKFSAEEGT